MSGTAAYTTAALIAFAANSVLCRLALGEQAIDAATFSTVRLGSGAVALAIAVVASGGAARLAGSWASAAMLFLYALPFSFAYVELATGTGALILFGAVQVTMMTAALRSGERPHALQWVGLGLALGGLLYLVSPGLAAPSPAGAALMAVAGFAWGIYSLRGQGEPDPLGQTMGNFVRAVPLAVAVSAATVSQLRVTMEGALLAVASGAVASGLGYTIWYRALRGLTATRAAVVQLSVPVLAAAGGVLFMSEQITVRLVLASVMVLGGVGVALLGRERHTRAVRPVASGRGEAGS